MNVGPSTNQIATFLVYFARMRSSVGGHTCARIRHVQRAKINSSNVMINEGRFGLNPWPDTAKEDDNIRENPIRRANYKGNTVLNDYMECLMQQARFQ